MSHRRARSGRVLICLGLAAILAAALMTCYDAWDEDRAGRDAATALAQLQALEPSAGTHEVTDLSGPLPEVERDGVSYVGVLELPAIGLTLPVQTRCTDSALGRSPCRLTGSLYDGDLVVVGLDYASHFGLLRDLVPGDEVRFTDVRGDQFDLQVATVDESAEGGDCPLTLICDRVTVRCAFGTAAVRQP